MLRRLRGLRSAAQLEKERALGVDVLFVDEMICADRVLSCEDEGFVRYRKVLHDLPTEIEAAQLANVIK